MFVKLWLVLFLDVAFHSFQTSSTSGRNKVPDFPEHRLFVKLVAMVKKLFTDEATTNSFKIIGEGTNLNLGVNIN